MDILGVIEKPIAEVKTWASREIQEAELRAGIALCNAVGCFVVAQRKELQNKLDELTGSDRL
jgi:hypothetical protein